MNTYSQTDTQPDLKRVYSSSLYSRWFRFLKDFIADKIEEDQHFCEYICAYIWVFACTYAWMLITYEAGRNC